MIQSVAIEGTPDQGRNPEATAPKMDRSGSQTIKYVVGPCPFAAAVFAVLTARAYIVMIVLAALTAFVVRPVIDALSYGQDASLCGPHSPAAAEKERTGACQGRDAPRTGRANEKREAFVAALFMLSWPGNLPSKAG